jgi:hypothetical protein
MARFKTNEYTFSVNNGVVGIEKYDSNMGMNEEIGRYDIDLIINNGDKAFTITTNYNNKTYIVPDYIMGTVSAYCKTMKLYPKNNQEKF